MKLSIVIATTALCLSGAATAESVPHPGACKADAKTFCASEAKSRDKAKIQACLVANAAKVSSDCRENLQAASAAKAASSSATPAK